MRAHFAMLCVVALALGLHASTATTLSLPQPPFARDGIRNVVSFHDDFYSGSAPAGDGGFDSLLALGIKSVLSVDGAIPDVQRIEARGMRSVHLPIGYGGFDDARKAELVRAVRDLPRPLYLHCHHGKHRSASAAATIAVSLGWLTSAEAQSRMKLAGTAAQYKGLWECAARAVPMPSEAIDAARADFPRITNPATFVAAMVAIDESFDQLKLLEKSGWTALADHPDITPLSQAGQFADLFRVLADPPAIDTLDNAAVSQVRSWLAASAAQAASLESLINDRDFAAASTLMTDIRTSCQVCHSKYRE